MLIPEGRLSSFLNISKTRCVNESIAYKNVESSPNAFFMFTYIRIGGALFQFCAKQIAKRRSIFIFPDFRNALYKHAHIQTSTMCVDVIESKLASKVDRECNFRLEAVRFGRSFQFWRKNFVRLPFCDTPRTPFVICFSY